MIRSAYLSPDGRYRYTLRRDWDSLFPRMLWVMLNPSTADDKQDDPTLRRCIAFAEHWGYGGISVVNLFALRSTNPRLLWKAEDPIGPECDRWIEFESASACRVLIAWGSLRRQCSARARAVVEILYRHHATLHSLGATVDGDPRHPLYTQARTIVRPHMARLAT